MNNVLVRPFERPAFQLSKQKVANFLRLLFWSLLYLFFTWYYMSVRTMQETFGFNVAVTLRSAAALLPLMLAALILGKALASVAHTSGRTSTGRMGRYLVLLSALSAIAGEAWILRDEHALIEEVRIRREQDGVPSYWRQRAWPNGAAQIGFTDRDGFSASD
jgi:hypothetical protein